jgi:hypothetical protein
MHPDCRATSPERNQRPIESDSIVPGRPSPDSDQTNIPRGECKVATWPLVDRHRRESQPRRGKLVAVAPDSRTFGSIGADVAPPARSEANSPPGWSRSTEVSAVPPAGGVPPEGGRVPAERSERGGDPGWSYGGGRMLGSGSPESPPTGTRSTVSPTSRTEAPSSSGKTNPRERPFEGTAPFPGGRRTTSPAPGPAPWSAIPSV